MKWINYGVMCECGSSFFSRSQPSIPTLCFKKCFFPDFKIHIAGITIKLSPNGGCVELGGSETIWLIR